MSELNCECFHKIVIGGDQLTVARCRAAQIGHRNEVHLTKHLRGLLPVVEDWHAKQCFLEVCHFFKWNMHTCIFEYNMVHLNTFLYAYMQLMWMRLYRQASSREKGTVPIAQPNTTNLSSTESERRH